MPRRLFSPPLLSHHLIQGVFAHLAWRAPVPGGHSRHIARKGVQKIESLPRLERGLRRQHGPHAGAAALGHLYDDCTFRQGLEKMRHHGYTAIPVISRDGKYVGTVSEGDFLWQLLSKDCETLTAYSMKDMERLQVRDILRGNSYPPVRITVTMEELLHSAMNQNFIPVVDDLGNFTGIVTRKDIIRYFAEQKDAAEPLPLRKIV